MVTIEAPRWMRLLPTDSQRWSPSSGAQPSHAQQTTRRHVHTHPVSRSRRSSRARESSRSGRSLLVAGNRLALQSDLLGATLHGVENVFCVTDDDVTARVP